MRAKRRDRPIIGATIGVHARFAGRRRRSVLAVATGVGLDPARLALDMNSAAVQAKLDRTRALTDVFGFAGTPGLVTGRTAAKGGVPGSLRRRIIADERPLPFLAC